MKFPAAIVFALLTVLSASAQKKAPNGYLDAPALTITGDFDGDGTQDTFSQFITDSLGNKLDYIIEPDWEKTPQPYFGYDYNTAYTLNGKPCPMDNYIGVGLFCLINLGDINATKGDDIALVPMLSDYTMLNTCSIYSYCIEKWVKVFSFAVNENSFSYPAGKPDPIFANIPEYLEKRNGKWVFMDYMEWLNAEETLQMKPLKVGNCN